MIAIGSIIRDIDWNVTYLVVGMRNGDILMLGNWCHPDSTKPIFKADWYVQRWVRNWIVEVR